MSADLIELTNLLSGWMLHLAGRAGSPEAGGQASDELLRSGAAWKAWVGIVEAQGGDAGVFENPQAFHQPAASAQLAAEAAGFIISIDTTQVGWAVQRLGAGRAKPGDPVSAHAGIEVHAKLGDRVEAGQRLVTLHAADQTLLAEPLEMLREAYVVGAVPPVLARQLREVIVREV
jgi:pyrimidine-nucleoside phosphorylase